jgi:hypothetical protein
MEVTLLPLPDSRALLEQMPQKASAGTDQGLKTFV